MESQKGDLVLHSKSGHIFLPLAHGHPWVTTEHIIHQMNGRVFSGGIFFFPQNCLVDSAEQRDSRHSHTNAPAITGGGMGTHPKASGSTGFAILLPAHSQTTLSWLWNCTLSSCRTSWHSQHAGPFQGKEKTHRRNIYLWVCSEKAAESTTVRKCFGRENYGSLRSARAVMTGRLGWFFSFSPRKTHVFEFSHALTAPSAQVIKENWRDLHHQRISDNTFHETLLI